jgi:hypothetical protein
MNSVRAMTYLICFLYLFLNVQCGSDDPAPTPQNLLWKVSELPGIFPREGSYLLHHRTIPAMPA